jgi:hypothetical protein
VATIWPILDPLLPFTDRVTLNFMQTLESIRRFHREHHSIVCGPGHALSRSATTIREYYDKQPFPAFFVVRLARTNPHEVYKMLVHALGRMPANGLRDDLLLARAALLDPDTDESELQRHYEIMNAPEKPARPHQYYRLVYYMLKWHLGIAPDTNLIAVQEKMQEQLRSFGVPDHKNVLLSWFKEGMPFEKWVNL